MCSRFRALVPGFRGRRGDAPFVRPGAPHSGTPRRHNLQCSASYLRAPLTHCSLLPQQRRRKERDSLPSSSSVVKTGKRAGAEVRVGGEAGVRRFRAIGTRMRSGRVWPESGMLCIPCISSSWAAKSRGVRRRRSVKRGGAVRVRLRSESVAGCFVFRHTSWGWEGRMRGK